MLQNNEKQQKKKKKKSKRERWDLHIVDTKHKLLLLILNI